MSVRPMTVSPPGESVEPAATRADSAGSEGIPLWKSPSLELLAQRQGVAPVFDLDEISALWPEDDDPDELLEHILTERSARRRIVDSGDAA